jgi:hypothetical protein
MGQTPLQIHKQKLGPIARAPFVSFDGANYFNSAQNFWMRVQAFASRSSEVA